MSEKAILRAAFKARRDSLQALPETEELRFRLAENLAKALGVAPAFLPKAATGTLPAPRIASFLPMGSEFDPNGTASADWLFPRVRPGGRLSWFRWGDEGVRSRLVRNRYGILEAPEEECFECDATPEAPWIVIVPALACDLAHLRLGYGGGFYDRFLAAPEGGKRRGVFSICAVPEAFFVEALPGEAWDLPVDMVVTQTRVSVRA